MRDRKRPFLVLTAWIFLASGAVRGADSSWSARVWQSDDGLPDNNVTGVAQTSDGYLWVATQGGLAKFDGVQFKRQALPIIAGASVEMIRALTVSGGDHLWLALEGGVVMSVSARGTRAYTSADGLWVYRPSCIASDGDGAIWVAYWDGTACRIADGKAKHFSEKEGLPATGICWLATDVRKRLWFAQGGRVGVLRDGHFESLTTLQEHPLCIAARRDRGVWACAGRELYRIDEGTAPRKSAELGSPGEAIEPLTLFEDQTGAVWIGTAASGLFRYDGTNVARVETSRGEIRCVTEDREGDIWVGSTGGGLNRLRPRALELLGAEHGLPFETIRSVCEDSLGSLWVVTQNGFVAVNRGESWSVVSTNSDWPRGQASCIASDKRGDVWIGTTDNGLYRWRDGQCSVMHQRDGLVSDRIWTLMADSESNLWVASDRPNCVQRLHDEERQRFELPAGSRVVRAMAEDPSRQVWFGTEDGRLLDLVGSSLVEEAQPSLSRPAPIRCLQATADGVWIGYGGAGLGWRDGGRFMRVGTEQGLPDDFVSQIAADNRGALWLAGNRGVFSIQVSELRQLADGRINRIRATSYGKNEGLPSLQANFGFGLAAVRTHDGRICFSMLTGLAVVHPDRIEPNIVAPPVLIERLTVDGRVLVDAEFGGSGPFADQPLDISQTHRELKFDFNALSFVAPGNVRLRYQLDGCDQKPIETTARNATYSYLPAGSYRFHVTACNNSGVWNADGASLAFIVEPLFWQTWWFRLGFLVAFTGATIALVRYISFRRLRHRLQRLEQESVVAKDRARIAKDLHDDLGAHLSHIAMLSELAQTDFDKPTQARDHLDQIFRTARLLTRSLDEIVWAVNPRNDALERFVGHVCQFAPEFLRAAGIRSRLDMPMDLPPVELAANVRHQLYLGLKEALHNIVKHSSATEVWLRLSVAEDALTLTVEDNGRGFDTGAAPKNGGDGLINLRHRMGEIGGRLEQDSQPDRGARITFVVPIEGARAVDAPRQNC